jgi:acetate kinase
VATALPEVESLIFTGGIGARSAMVRDGVMKRLAPVRVGEVLTIEAREDAVVTSQVAELLSK